ncbi:hypothetical protein L208DRAFT_1376989 [Tricholoma matsutake]|nr:hypothetical protein L208DRAFT_1376989 [Tricholoma matsutake 945]
MTTSLLEHKRDYVVLIIIPLPSKDEEEKGITVYLAKPYDHYKEIAASQVPGDQNELSMKAQMAPMVNNSAEYMDELCKKHSNHHALLMLELMKLKVTLLYPVLLFSSHYPYGHNLFIPPTQYANVHHPIGNAGLPPSPLPSPGAALQLCVLLEEFCARYKILDYDQEKLRWLEYQPGHAGVTKLEEKHWLAEKFTLLGWEGFMDAHWWFLKDVQSGTWAPLCGV